MDHNRAFGAIDASTLEVAAQEVDYPLPPHKVGFICSFALQQCEYAKMQSLSQRFMVQSIASSLAYDAKGTEERVACLVQIQDKIGFLINNLSAANLEQKAKDLGGLLSEEQWPWFCNYMVVKRAAQEPNFHSLYVNLLLALQVSLAWYSNGCTFHGLAMRPSQSSVLFTFSPPSA